MGRQLLVAGQRTLRINGGGGPDDAQSESRSSVIIRGRYSPWSVKTPRCSQAAGPMLQMKLIDLLLLDPFEGLIVFLLLSVLERLKNFSLAAG